MGWWDIRRATGVGPIVAGISARYRRPVTFPDTLKVGVRISLIEGERFTMTYRIVSGRPANLTTEGESLQVAYDYRTLKKAPLTYELREMIAKVEGRDASVLARS